MGNRPIGMDCPNTALACLPRPLCKNERWPGPALRGGLFLGPHLLDNHCPGPLRRTATMGYSASLTRPCPLHGPLYSRLYRHLGLGGETPASGLGRSADLGRP